jgi:hypothetical protein
VHPRKGHQVATVARVTLGGHRGLRDWADGPRGRCLHGCLLWGTCRGTTQACV